MRATPIGRVALSALAGSAVAVVCALWWVPTLAPPTDLGQTPAVEPRQAGSHRAARPAPDLDEEEDDGVAALPTRREIPSRYVFTTSEALGHRVIEARGFPSPAAEYGKQLEGPRTLEQAMAMPSYTAQPVAKATKRLAGTLAGLRESEMGRMPFEDLDHLREAEMYLLALLVAKRSPHTYRDRIHRLLVEPAPSGIVFASDDEVAVALAEFMDAPEWTVEPE